MANNSWLAKLGLIFGCAGIIAGFAAESVVPVLVIGFGLYHVVKFVNKLEIDANQQDCIKNDKKSN